ncbi:MAG: hypothetical protein FGM25_00625 [Mycobacterium sp.]|nr:hypothetical protein [Mycobacterium sp.]
MTGEIQRWTRPRVFAAAAGSFGVGLTGAVLLYYGGSSSGPLLALLVGAGLVLGAYAAYPRVRSDRTRPPQSTDPPPVRPVARPSRAAPVARPPAQPPQPRITPPGPDLVVATVVHTDAELSAMLEDRPPCWRYAAFVSVLVQRRDAVRSRLLDAMTGFATPSGEKVHSGFQAGLFFTERLEDLSQFVNQIDDFMLSAAFRGVFGGMFDEASADAAGIVHAANRLMDYHDGLLSLSERCRGVAVPAECRELHRDFGLLTALPLEGFERFIDDFTDRVAEMGDVARFATGNVQLDPVELGVTDDGDLPEKVSKQLEALRNSR